MSSMEERLILLAMTYGRFSYEEKDKFGFADRGTTPTKMYDTLEEAINAEERDIRQQMIDEQVEIARLERSINTRLIHLGILEIG